MWSWRDETTEGYSREWMSKRAYTAIIGVINLTFWGRVTNQCVSKLTSIGSGSGSGMSPGRRQAIIWNNVEILIIGPLGTNFSEI